MFLPTSIDYPYMDRSWVTMAIFGLCVVLLFTHVLEHDLPAGVALDPADFAPHQLVTSIFFHVGPLHLLGNMLFLYVFGRYVEARLGHLKYAAAFLLFGLVAGVAWLAFGPEAPAVGSSGAICGLVGFVLAIAPRNRLNMMVLFGPRVVGGFDIAVGWMIAWWVGWDLFGLVSGDDGGIAIVAHLGGYAAGYGLGFGLSRPELEDTPWYVEPAPTPGDGSQTKRLRKTREGRTEWPVGRRAGVRPPPEPLRNACPHEVVLRALGPETSPVGVIKLLMKRKGLAPERAKVLVDALAQGREQVVAFETVDGASQFAQEGRQLDVELSLRTVPAPS